MGAESFSPTSTFHINLIRLCSKSAKKNCFSILPLGHFDFDCDGLHSDAPRTMLGKRVRRPTDKAWGPASRHRHNLDGVLGSRALCLATEALRLLACECYPLIMFGGRRWCTLRAHGARPRLRSRRLLQQVAAPRRNRAARPTRRWPRCLCSKRPGRRPVGQSQPHAPRARRAEVELCVSRQ